MAQRFGEDIEYEGVGVVATTDLALLLAKDDREDWFPKSAIDWSGAVDPQPGDVLTVYIPDSWVEKKGW